MSLSETPIPVWLELLAVSKELPSATRHFPSRGQSEVQKLYKTSLGKVFLKRVSARNHKDCQVDPHFGSLAERETWAHALASHVGLTVPDLICIDRNTTLQNWLDIPDAHIFKQRSGPLKLDALNVFECALFDWLTGQIDRHDANYLYDFVHEKIILIDSAHCFLKYEGSLPDYLSLAETHLAGQLHKKLESNVCFTIKNLRLSELDQLIPIRHQDERVSLFLRLDKMRRCQTLKDIITLYRGAK